MAANTLFRAEALAHKKDRLHGTVSLATPLPWQLIGFLLLAALVAALGFLASATYARSETVTGTVTLDRGLATIVPSRAGIVATLDVREGQRVRAGERLATIRAEEDMVAGDTAPDRIRDSLRAQDARLAAQSTLLLRAADADRARLAESVAGLRNEIASLDAQIADQQRLVAAAAREFADVQQVADRGFISRRDLEAREAAVLARRQQLAQFEQLRAQRRAALAEASRASTQTLATAQAQAAGAESSRAGLQQQLAQVDLARGYAITAPVDGVVTGLTARVGQPAKPDQQLMMVVPARSTPQVELYVPTSAVGFVAPRQEVRVAIDAFPYQRFGTVPARVDDVSTAALVRTGPNGPVPIYLVTATLPRPWVAAFGARQRLVPGMTLSARIVTQRRSLIEWLFEPLFAVRNR